MVNEITDGLSSPGIFHKVIGGAQALKNQFKGKKVTIAMMPHESLDDEDGLFQKNLVYTIRLRNPNEALAGFTEGEGYVDAAYSHAADAEALKRMNKTQKKKLKARQLFEKHRKNKELNAALAELDEKEIAYATEWAPVHVDAFVVRENERALFIQAGQSLGVVEPGMWTIDEQFSQSGTEIIYVDISQFQFNWGFSDILTAEHAKVGAHGTCILKIRDPRNFIINIISSKSEANQKTVADFLFNKLKSTIKTIIGKTKILDLVHEEDKVFAAKVRSKMHESLESWGLDIVDVILLGFKLPAEFEKLFKEQSQDAVEDVRVDLDAKATEREIARLQNQAKFGTAEQQVQANLEIQKMQLEMQKKQQEMQLELMKQQLAMQQKQHEAELAKIHRKITAEDKLAEIDVNEIAGMSSARVKSADLGAENVIRTHELDRMRLDSQRQVDIARIDAGGNQSQLGYQERMAQQKYERDIAVARITGQGSVQINDRSTAPGMGKVQSSQPSSGDNKISTLETKKSNLEKKLDNLDNMLMEGKINQDMYERRSNLILAEIEDLRREILSLKRIS